MKRTLLAFTVLLFCILSNAQEVLITGYMDSSCPQAKGRTLELYVSGTVDFSGWNLVRQSNGNGYTFNINITGLGTITDNFAYITNDSDILNQEFDLENAVILQSGSINDNGDDAFQIVDNNGQITDRFGEENVQPVNGDTWFHQKTFYYRNNGESANYGNFNPDNWTFGEIGLLLGNGLCNGGDAFENLVPFGTFNPLLCEAVTALPFTEDFEDIIPPAIPNCSVVENTGTGNNWETAYRTNSNVLKYKASTDESASAWFFTRGIELESNVNYRLKFKYGNNDPSAIEKLKVAIGKEQNSSSMEVIFEENQISSGGLHWAVVNFTVDDNDVYYPGFYANSEANQNELYIDKISVDLAPTCPEPLNLKTEELSQNSAHIIWMNEENASEWGVIYGEPGFNPNSEGNTISVETSPEVILENLTPGTIYEVFVKRICGDSEESNFSEPLQFKTFCDAVELPFVQSFEDLTPPSVPYCAVNQNLSAGNNWETAEINGFGFSGNVLRYIANDSNPANAWYFIQAADLESGVSYQLSYTYGNNSTVFSEKLNVGVGSYPDAESMVILEEYTDINQATALPGEIAFEPSENGIYFFGFQANSDSGQGEIYLDHITLKVAPQCAAPEGLSVNEITNTTVQVSWNSGSEVEEWEVVYGPIGFNPENQGQSVFVQDTPEVSLTDLNPGTDYQLYIRANCGLGDWSNFSPVVDFTTFCGVLSIPYYEDFENISPPEFPNCSTVENAGTGNSWETYDEALEENPVMNSKVLRYQYDVYNSANTWFFTPGIELEAGVNYQLSYTFANNTPNPNFFEKLKTGLGTSPDPQSMSVLTNHPHISGGIAENHSFVFAVEESDIYYFGFNAYSNFNASILYLDDIEITLGPSCPQPLDVGFTNLNHQSVEIFWDAPGNTTNWEVTYGYQGFNPETEGIEYFNTETTEQFLSDLESETFYDTYVRSICGDETGPWSQPVTFYTLITPPVNNFLCDAIALTLDYGCQNGVFTNRGAFMQDGENYGSCLPFPAGTKTVWFSFQAPESGAVILSTVFPETEILSEIVIYNAPDDCENPETLGEELGCAYYGSNIFMGDLTPGATYYFKVGGAENTMGNFCVDVQTSLNNPESAYVNFLFHPNPVRDILTLENDLPIDLIEIYDLKGRKLLSDSTQGARVQINMQTLPTGVYLMKVQVNGMEKFYKVIRN